MTRIITRVAASFSCKFLRRRFAVSPLCASFIFFLSAPLLFAVPGDADGNGVVDIDDARTIARYLVGQIPAIPNPADADVNQDGVINTEDAFAIAQHVTGSTRFVVAAPRYGGTNSTDVGQTIRIEVFEKFFPFNVTGGTARITSASTGYDSGSQPLTFERDGRSLYYHWNTAGLQPANDYQVNVSLDQSTASSLQKAMGAVNAVSPADATPLTGVVSLTPRFWEPPILASAVDAFCPAPGIPLVLRRVAPHDSQHYPYQGPFGRSWVHNYDIGLEEYTDGRIAFHGPEGFNRFFTPQAGGTYNSSPGDHGILTRDVNGTFQLKEKSGLMYHFRSDLRFDFMEDLNGNRVTGVYNSNNQLAEIRHSCGKSFFLEYNNLGYITKLTDHVGRVTSYTYGPMNYVIAAIQIVYVGVGPRPADLALGLVEHPDGSISQYKYLLGQSPQLNWRLTEICDLTTTNVGVGVFEGGFPRFNTTNSVFTHFDYNSDGRLIRWTGTWGANPLNYAYTNGTVITDGVGANTVVQVNEFGNIVTSVDPDNGVTLNDYDTDRNLVQTADPLNRVSRFGYDEFGNLVTSINAMGETVQMGYNLQFQKPAWVVDPLGKRTSFLYDGPGNLQQIAYPDGTQDSFTYDPNGNLKAYTDALNNTTRFAYNAQGLATAVTNALGQVIRFSYSTAGDLSAVTNARGYALTMTRDTLGRVTSRTYADASHEDYEYDAAGKVTAFTNRRGDRLTYEYDAAGQLITRSYPSGKKYRFLYDARGLLKSVEKEEGGVRTLDVDYEADLSRRITKIKLPGRLANQTYDMSFGYDAAGNRTLMVYPDGYVLRYEYDSVNRLKRISDGASNTVATFQYDDAGRRTRRDLGNGTYAVYGYDLVDRLVGLTNFAASGTVQSQFGYTLNNAGLRTAATTTEGVHTYAYDGVYQLTNVIYPDGRNVQYQFDANGNRAQVTDNGASTTYTANALDQYTQAGTSMFTYDDSGNLISASAGTSTNLYEWDEENRLTSANRGGVQVDYRYDYEGRLIEKVANGITNRFIWDRRD